MGMGKSLINKFLILFLVIICIGCESQNSTTNSQIKEKCDKPSWRELTTPVTENIFMKGFSLSDQSMRSDKYYKHYTDKHGTKWNEEKTGYWRMVYDIELKTLKVYKNRKLIKKHRNVTAHAKGIENLYEPLCFYHQQKYLSCEYISGDDTILIMSEDSFSYIPNKKNKVEFSSSPFYRDIVKKIKN